MASLCWAGRERVSKKPKSFIPTASACAFKGQLTLCWPQQHRTKQEEEAGGYWRRKQLVGAELVVTVKQAVNFFTLRSFLKNISLLLLAQWTICTFDTEAIDYEQSKKWVQEKLSHAGFPHLVVKNVLVSTISIFYATSAQQINGCRLIVRRLVPSRLQVL